MVLQISKLLVLYDFNRFLLALYGQISLLWSKLQRFPYKGGVSFFGGIGATLNIILFFSHLFKVNYTDNLLPYQGFLFLLGDFLRYAVCDVNHVNKFPRQSVTLKRELVPLQLFSQTRTFLLLASL